ncbi:translocon subunit SSS1 [Aspergillus udagawae]|uniref:Sec61p translocation complex subunit n=1 Tax=Aspergillus udagawae TaxID=91492 RepID=A0A8E0QPK1_9EURO|nr:sec61p translocation complex subunit [Aspergillus udagawae]GIC86626.1 sec61p translocation complex subunit [Aspergillus udagawae]
MSDTIQELADIPRDFLRDGMLFVRRCTKPDKREFIKISQAVGMGFIIMGGEFPPYRALTPQYFSGDAYS